MSEKVTYEDLSTRAGWAKGLLITSALVFVISAFADLQIAAGDFDAFDTAENIYGILVLVALATAVAFVVWSYRAHANLRALGRKNVFHSDQATIWWWIVPIAFLFMPFRVVYETVRGSTAPDDDTNWRKAKLDPSAVWWTVLWLGGMGLLQLASRMGLQASSLDEINAALTASAVGSGLVAGAGVAATVMVHRVTEAQRDLHRRQQSSPASEHEPSSTTSAEQTRPRPDRNPESGGHGHPRHAETPPTDALTSSPGRQISEAHTPTRSSTETATQSTSKSSKSLNTANDGTDDETAFEANYCSRCGFQFGQGDNFCAKCGASRFP